MDFGSMLAGGVIGLVVAIVKDYFGDKRKEKEKEKQFKMEKLEKAFMLLTDLDTKVNDSKDRLLSEGEYNSFELTMIIRFYFSNIHDEYMEYLKYSMVHSLQVKKHQITQDKMKEYYEKYRKRRDSNI